MSRWRRAAITAVVVIACAAAGAPAAADGGHLPGFSVADKRVAIAKLPEMLRFSFGDIPGVKGSGFTHVGHGPIWFGEAKRPKGTVYVGGNGRWVCVSEERMGEQGGGTSCTEPAAAREWGILDVRSCSKGPPRHFRVVALVPDGVDAIELRKADGKIGRTVPVIGNTVAFTIGREDFVMHGIGDPTAEPFERGVSLAWTAHQPPGEWQAGCTSYTFAEERKPSAGERAP
jgi:hypothetical protein